MNLIKQFLLLALLVFSSLFSQGQTSPQFHFFDEKNGFKDVVFGSPFSSLKDKMLLTDVSKEFSAGDFEINGKFYKSAGDIHGARAFAHFVNDQFCGVTLTLEKFGSVNVEIVEEREDSRLKYLEGLFGKATKVDDSYYWYGANIFYCYQPHYFFIIGSQKIKKED